MQDCGIPGMHLVRHMREYGNTGILSALTFLGNRRLRKRDLKLDTAAEWDPEYSLYYYISTISLRAAAGP